MLLIDPVTKENIDANVAAAHFYDYSLEQLRAMKITDLSTLAVDETHEKMSLAISVP